MRSWLLVVTALLLSLAAGDVVAQLQEIPQLTGPVVDQVNALGGARGELEAKLRKLKEEKGSEVAVLIVASTAPETIEQFSIRVVDQWKLGRKGIDDGVLLVVAIQDRAVRIEVGRGLEGDIPDVTAFRIIQEQILPRFRSGDIPGGIDAGAQSIINRINGLDLPPRADEEQKGAGALFVVLVFFFVGSALAGLFGSAIGASVGASLGLFAALLFSSVVGSAAIAGIIWVLVFFRDLVFEALATGSRGHYSGGRGGYGGGSFGGGSFGSGGGFSGGGASGRW